MPVGDAANYFEKYKQDIKLMNELQIKHYRFSISWTRIMPDTFGIIDPSGVQFYHDVIDECIKYNITPYATMYHWDLPEYIDVMYNGWLNESIIRLFYEYSVYLFSEYGHKVDHWMTINEPLTTSNQGYGPTCNFAPGKCSLENKYISAKNQLLAHAYAGKYYLDHYKGEIGIVLNANWIQPKNKASIPFAEKQMEDSLGLFLHPLIHGEFPPSLINHTFPFTRIESDILKHSFNILCINHYTTYYVDEHGHNSVNQEWEQGESSWLFNAPFGLNNLLDHIYSTYTNYTPIYITECGFSEKHDSLLDIERVHYLSGYLAQFKKCIQKGMHTLRGFFVWSFLDNFEWSSGYNETFGIIYVDRNADYQRKQKLSAAFIKNINTYLENI
jgi:beta-glucosidase/6-phospho-beta-glucosidase/beta-galactosidase